MMECRTAQYRRSREKTWRRCA